MRTLDFHRGLTTLLAVGLAGFLIWIATQVGQQTTGRFWASMGIVAGAGLVLAASQLLGGWTKFGMPRLSLGVFLLGFLPVLIGTVWIALATQPGNGWQEGRLRSWSETLGIYGFVREVGLYHGVLAFAFGLALGFCFDTHDRRRERVAAAPTTEPAAGEPAAAERTAVVEREPALTGTRSAVGYGTRVESREPE
jgi:hypothetical protein